MVSKYLTSAAFAAALATAPAAPVTADGKDFIAGAIIGGVVGSQLQKNADRQRNQQPVYQAPAAQQSATGVTRSYSGIPATEEGREIQSSLNYFGFGAGTVDGQVGPQTRDAIADYQRYMGYEPTGQLTAFERELLLRSHIRAQAGGDRTFRQIASHPDGTRGLLKVYRSEIANGLSDGSTDATYDQTGS